MESVTLEDAMKDEDPSSLAEATWLSPETYKHLNRTETNTPLTELFPDGMLAVHKTDGTVLALNCSREKLKTLTFVQP